MQQPLPFEPEPLGPRTIEPRTLEPRTLEPRTVEPTVIKPRTIEPSTVEPRAIEPEPKNAEPRIANLSPRVPNPESQVPNSEPRFPLVFTRHPRARRYVLRVDADGVIQVTVPRWGSKREAREFAARERAWIERQLTRLDAERERRRASAAPAVDPAQQRELRERAHRELPPRLLELAALHGLAVSRVSIRNQRWRWGSCNRAGHICLNWRLVTMPDAVRDYVLIHELMHLKRLDHSPKFWKLVAAACPRYQDARRWLRKVAREQR
jgi:predicted metal-dependent hydrolase